MEPTGEKYTPLSHPYEGYDTDIMFKIQSPYYHPQMKIKWVNQDILVTRELFHSFLCYKFLLSLKRNFFRFMQENIRVQGDKPNSQEEIENMSTLWNRTHYEMAGDKCELGERGMGCVIDLIVTQANNYHIDLALSPYGGPMTFKRAISVLRVQFESVLSKTRIGQYCRLLPGLAGEDLVSHSIWESDAMKRFGTGPEHWWWYIMLPKDGVGGCHLGGKIGVKGKKQSY